MISANNCPGVRPGSDEGASEHQATAGSKTRLDPEPRICEVTSAPAAGRNDTPGRWQHRASDAGRQVGEAAAASDHGVKLGELLVAAVVAAFGDELARDVEPLPRLLASAAVALGGQPGGGGLGSTRPLSGAKASSRASASRAASSAQSHQYSRINPGSAISFASLRSRFVPSQSPTARRNAARARKPRGRWSFRPEARRPSTASSSLSAAARALAIAVEGSPTSLASQGTAETRLDRRHIPQG